MAVMNGGSSGGTSGGYKKPKPKPIKVKGNIARRYMPGGPKETRLPARPAPKRKSAIPMPQAKRKSSQRRLDT
jgi:hypothetical protein